VTAKHTPGFLEWRRRALLAESQKQELLKALRWAVSFIEVETNANHSEAGASMVESFRAAIAKAEGQ
jgi:hypothetical protein